jgi:hypothetical protein
LRRATRELSWLLTRDYAIPSALKLVGDRYQLTSRQRQAVSRSACSDQQRFRRRQHRVSASRLRGRTLAIDGYNVLTSVEAALAGGVILVGRDGCFRDLASMHGTYRQVAETLPALELLGGVLAAIGVMGCQWYFDAPVSNSGRLKQFVSETARARGWDWSVVLVPDPDAVLKYYRGVVATADSQVLDHCGAWFNLAREVIQSGPGTPWIVAMT